MMKAKVVKTRMKARIVLLLRIKVKLRRRIRRRLKIIKVKRMVRLLKNKREM